MNPGTTQRQPTACTKFQPGPHAMHPPIKRLNLNDAVDDLAPMPPPCFHNRSGWLAYLKSAAGAQNHASEPKVILISQERVAVFNFDFPFCADCTQVKSAEMHAKGRCNKDYLVQLKVKFA